MNPLHVRSLVVVLPVAFEGIDYALVIVIVSRELGVHPCHERGKVHRIGIEDLLIYGLPATDIPSLPVVLSHEFPGIVVRPFCDVIPTDVEEIRDGRIPSKDGVERPSGIILQALKECLIVLHDVEGSTYPAFEEIIEIAGLQDGLDKIPGSSRQDGRAFPV